MNRRHFLGAAIALPVSAAMPAFGAPVWSAIDLALSKDLSVSLLMKPMGRDCVEFEIERIWVSDEFADLINQLSAEGYSAKFSVQK